MFEIKNITKKYGNDFALQNISTLIGSGLNFIVGSSGSGKTSLLKIISGIDNDFDGEVLYNGKSIRDKTEEEKSILYGKTFGFIWQDFNLFDDWTVLENVLLPISVPFDGNSKEALKILKSLKISQLKDQKVKNLSGGQKQRVAIARELMKNPSVLIADEPTSALDEVSKKATLILLEEIAKTRTVIIVTHDVSMIGKSKNVYELEKGELVKSPILKEKNDFVTLSIIEEKLLLKKAFQLVKTSIKNKKSRFFISVFSMIVATTLLLVSGNGSIVNQSEKMFQRLMETYGNSILDIDVVGSFMSAAGSDKNEPNADVTQDISGLYEKYNKDSRVSYGVFSQSFHDIKIKIEGKDYFIKASGNAPVFNDLIIGRVPDNSKEVVVPESFVKQMGITKEEILGKTMDLKSSIYNWDSGEPILMPIQVSAMIVGVIDTTAFYEYEGAVNSYNVEDAFFFSKQVIDDARTQANMKSNAINFTIRVKTPNDLIAIKDELNAQGIVPLGQFEKMEDVVRLNNQTKNQTKNTSLSIAIISLCLVLAICVMNTFMRTREYAIYKISGYSSKKILFLSLIESAMIFLGTIFVFFALSPILNGITMSVFSSKILKLSLFGLGLLCFFGLSIINFLITIPIIFKKNSFDSLKTGDKS